MRIWCAVALMVLMLFFGCTGSQNSGTQFPFNQQTKYFNFHYQRNSATVAGTIRFSDGFVDIVKRDFFKADHGYPIQVFICQDEHEFDQFLHHDLEIPDPSDYGIYLFSRKLLATYEDSGLGTFTHETLHPLLEENIPTTPAWTIEGIPTFFEKFYGYWNGNKLVLYWGYQNPWRIRQLGPHLTRLDLNAIVSENGGSEQDESQLRMASVFLWQQGKFRRLLRLVATNDRQGYPTYFEAAMGMPMDKIIPIWHSYLDSVNQHRAEVLSLPPSTVFSNETDFNTFVKEHGISTKQVRQLD